LLALTLALAPAVVSGALYPKDSLVKMIDTKTFRSAMKQNQTTLVAFVANWCGHCQRMVPEYSKAALGLYPLIPVYAVDCDENKALCAEQGVKGFPTVKLFPRGKYAPTVPYDSPERTASGFYYFATRRVPNRNQKLYRHEQIEPWVQQHSDKDRVLLLSKNKDVPLLWKVLANKYRDNFEFGSHRDRKGRTSVKLGYEAGSKKESKVLVYPAGAAKPVLFEGLLKYDSISKFFDSIIDGTADLSAANEAAKEEEFELSEEEQEIERKQEAQRLALAHGGFTDMIDFEEAVKKYGMDFHDSNGYGGMLSDMPKKKKAEDKAA
ncbi:thioredoxin-like protein, partial [Auriscalpium vulgare]